MLWVRRFVLLIAMFAVPFQGYAAAAMVFCGPGHAGVKTEMSVASPGMKDHVRPHSEGQGNSHHETEQASKPPANDRAAPTASAEPDAIHKCGTCGVCAACHAMALTSSLELAVFHEIPLADLAEPGIAIATFAPRVLDKPPRA